MDRRDMLKGALSLPVAGLVPMVPPQSLPTPVQGYYPRFVVPEELTRDVFERIYADVEREAIEWPAPT